MKQRAKALFSPNLKKVPQTLAECFDLGLTVFCLPRQIKKSKKKTFGNDVSGKHPCEKKTVPCRNLAIITTHHMSRLL